MMTEDEEDLLRSVAMQNAQSIRLARLRAEEELVRTKEWLRITLACIGDGVITTDSGGRVISLNPVAESLTGWTQSDAQNEPLDHVFHIFSELTREVIDNPALRALREGEVVGLADHTVLIAKDGTERAIDDSAAPIRDEQGHIIGAVLIFRDITERRRDEARLRESESQLRLVMDQAPVLIARFDMQTRFRFVNRGYAERLGLRVEEVVGQRMSEVLGEEAFECIRPHVDAVLAGQSVEYEAEVPYQRIGRRYVRCIYEPERNLAGQVQGWIAVVNDVTDRRQAAKTEAILGSIVESSQDAIISKTFHSQILSWNAGAEQLFGYSAEEAIGQSIKMIIPPDRQAEEGLILERLGRGERIEHYETVRLTKDGRRIDVSLSISPLRDGTGRIVGASKIARNITARKRAERTLRFLADASAELSEPTEFEMKLQRVAARAVPHFADWCIVDMQDANGTVRRVAVAHQDPAKSESSNEVRPQPALAPFVLKGVGNVLKTGQPEWTATIPEEILFEHGLDAEPLDDLRPLRLKSYICVPLKSRGCVWGALTFVTAESNRVYSNDDVRAAEDLAHRASTAIENVNLMATLQESDRRKDEFLAMLAHELRNPLAAVQNAVQILRANGPTGPEAEWVGEVIDRQVRQMSRLVDDLLDVSRINRGKIELRKEPIELAAVINNGIEASRPIIDQMGHGLTVTMPSEPIHLEADPTRLVQVLLNLLNNAAKYMDPGGSIRLAVKREGDQVQIRVKDAGIGISEEMLPRIFDMFTQLNRSLDRSQGGLGIGLTLVKRIVEMHEGSIEARSDGPGCGSEFVVRLPCVQTAKSRQEEHLPHDHKERPDRSQLRILVVDDNKDSAKTLAVLLRLRGNQVETAHDGLEAVNAALRFQPDVLLLDIGLPKLNGYDVATRIRAVRGDSVTLIALTGLGQEGDRERSKEAGFDHHLTKPVEWDALQAILADRIVRGGM